MSEPLKKTLRGAKLIDGRIAMVTGAAAGIGRACGILFSEQGGRVVLVDLNYEGVQKVCEEIRNRGGDAIGLQGDVKEEKDLNTIFETVAEQYGALDILINNAGGGLPTDFFEITSTEWNNVIQLNLTSVFMASQRAAGFLKQSSHGTIVNISSIAARSMSITAGCHYTSSKAGILGLTRHLAGILAPYGVRVNAVCPGVTNSERIIKRLEEEKRLEEVENSIPLGRIGDVYEIASCCLFLASDLAGYMTGATLDVNGGILML